jgi:hypothetical protein
VVKTVGVQVPPSAPNEVRARGSVGERFVHTEEVTGSNPVVPIDARLRQVAGAFFVIEEWRRRLRVAPVLSMAGD